MATRRQGLKRIKKRPLSERSEFRTLPVSDPGGAIGVENGARRPRPPNRTCGPPAYGSPVGSYPNGIASLPASPCARRTDKLVRGRHPAEPFASLDAVTSADNSQFVQQSASTQAQLRSGVSAPV